MHQHNPDNSTHTDFAIPKTPVRFVWSVMRPHGLLGVGAVLAVTIAQLLSSFEPFIIKHLVDAALSGAERTEQVSRVTFWSVLLVSMLGIQFAFWRVSGFTGMLFISRSAKTAYERLYEYVSLHSHTYFSNRFAGSLSNKISNVAEGTDRMIEGLLWGYGTGVLSLLISIGLFYSIGWVYGTAYTALVVMIACLNFLLVRYRRPFVVASAAASSRFRGVGVDMLSNMSTVRQYAKRDHELALLHESVTDKYDKNIRQWQISEWSLVVNNALIVAVFAGIVIYAVLSLKDGMVTVGDIVMVITLVFQTSGRLVFIGSSMNTIVRVYGDIQEGLGDTLERHEIVDRENAKSLTVSRGMISFDHVDFSYENQHVFSNLTLLVHPGERVGLVGGSGAGKTTLVSLLLRQHDVDRGAVVIDGQNIREVTQDSLRASIAVVPQEPQLFHRSIRENIGYGKLDATDSEIQEAARLAFASEFIDTLPERYETLVGERGVKLSGGQRQRIAIARAILKNSPILILDEATSALDSASEVVIQKALHTLMEGKTVIAIAHRLSTLREMDRIVVLDKGQIAESGTHDELIAQGGIYAGLWNHQSGGFIQD